MTYSASTFYQIFFRHMNFHMRRPKSRSRNHIRHPFGMHRRYRQLQSCFRTRQAYAPRGTGERGGGRHVDLIRQLNFRTTEDRERGGQAQPRRRRRPSRIKKRWLPQRGQRKRHELHTGEQATDRPSVCIADTGSDHA